jgi:YNFM family putative membrane transporter
MATFTKDRHRTTVLVLCVLAYFGIRFSEFVISQVLPDIKDSLGITTALVGVAITGSTITYAIVQLPSGVFGERFGERAVILAALGLTGVGSVLLALSPTGTLFVIAWMLLGLAGGIYYNPATALLTDLFDGTGGAIGTHRIGGQIVGLTAPVVAIVGAVYGWRVALALGAVVAFPVFTGVLVAVQPRNSVNQQTSIREQVDPELLSPFSRPSIAYTTVLASLGQFVDTAVFSYLPMILQEYHGYSLAVAGVLYLLYFVSVSVTQPVTGWLSDHIGRDLTAAVAFGIAIGGFGLLITSDGIVAVAVSVCLVGFGMGWNPPVQSRFIDHLSEDEQGMGFGLVRTVYIGFAALNGIIIGGIVTVANWPVAISVLGSVMAIALSVIGANQLLQTGF